MTDTIYAVLKRYFYIVNYPLDGLLEPSDIGNLEDRMKSAKKFFGFVKAGMPDLEVFLKNASEKPGSYVLKEYRMDGGRIGVIFITDEKLMKEAVVFGGVASAFMSHPSLPVVIDLANKIKGIGESDLDSWYGRFLEAYKSRNRRFEIRKTARDFVMKYAENLINELAPI